MWHARPTGGLQRDMLKDARMHLIVLAGDGIGPEITAATLSVLRAADTLFGLELRIEEDVAGLESLAQYGATVRPELVERLRKAEGFVLGPTTTPPPDADGNVAQGASAILRRTLDLFANIRPARTWPGLPARLGEFDLIIARENTEGFYADRNMARGNAEMLVTEDVVVSLRKVTRAACLRIAEQAFRLARTRRKRVTAVHKANVLKIGDGLFLDACRAVAAEFPDVAMDTVIVDAMAALLVRDPARFDVIVTTNMFGDILSDLAAELSGSLGLGGSLNAGKDHAMAQAAHGSAPDIAGKGIANPVSLILSGAMLLAWHGARHNEARFAKAAAAIETAVARAIEDGARTRDIGGELGTAEMGAAVAERVTAA